MRWTTRPSCCRGRWVCRGAAPLLHSELFCLPHGQGHPNSSRPVLSVLEWCQRAEAPPEPCRAAVACWLRPLTCPYFASTAQVLTLRRQVAQQAGQEGEKAGGGEPMPPPPPPDRRYAAGGRGPGGYGGRGRGGSGFVLRGSGGGGYYRGGGGGGYEGRKRQRADY